MNAKVCSVDGCGREVLSRGLCGKHYTAARTNGKLDRKEFPKLCSHEDCSKPYFAGGYCQYHYHKAYYRRRELEEMAEIEKACALSSHTE